ncbi:hypothetical protein DA2_3907 [Desulfovibrio sp. A2]|nr:hypothetical protein DA2_3907 [Desulfovibrio sp. A2]
MATDTQGAKKPRKGSSFVESLTASLRATMDGMSAEELSVATGGQATLSPSKEEAPPPAGSAVDARPHGSYDSLPPPPDNTSAKPGPPVSPRDTSAQSGHLVPGQDTRVPTGHPVSEQGTSDQTGHLVSPRDTSAPSGHLVSGQDTRVPTGHPVSAQGTSDQTGHPVSPRDTSAQSGHPVPSQDTSVPTGHPVSAQGTSVQTGHPVSPRDTSVPTGHQVSQQGHPSPAHDAGAYESSHVLPVLEAESPYGVDTQGVLRQGTSVPTRHPVTTQDTSATAGHQASHGGTGDAPDLSMSAPGTDGDGTNSPTPPLPYAAPAQPLMSRQDTSASTGHPVPKQGTSAPTGHLATEQDTGVLTGHPMPHDDTSVPTGHHQKRPASDADDLSRTVSVQDTRARAKVRPLATRMALLSSAAQVQLYDYILSNLGADGSIETSSGKIMRELGIPKRTLWRMLDRWEEKGVVKRESTRDGIRLVPLLSHGVSMGVAPDALTPVGASGGNSGPWPFDLSPEVYRERFPKLVAAGFGMTQMQQVHSMLSSKELPTDLVVVSLEYAEWELENDCMIDGRGTPVGSPADWLYKSLVTHGCYRKPRGYVDPIESAKAALEVKITQRKALLADMQRLREAEVQLELDEIVEAETTRLLASDDTDPLMREFLHEMPDFIRARGKDSAIFANEIRRRVRKRLLQEQGSG